MIWIGCDPGKKGAYAAIFEDHVEVWPWDDVFFVSFLHGLLATGDGIAACVEKVGAFSGQGVKSMFTFGREFGFIEGALQMAGISYQLVPPKKWKSEYGLGSDKTQSVEVCKKLFPGINLRRTNKCTTDSADEAEALLMALYAKRHFG